MKVEYLELYNYASDSEVNCALGLLPRTRLTHYLSLPPMLLLFLWSPFIPSRNVYEVFIYNHIGVNII